MGMIAKIQTDTSKIQVLLVARVCANTDCSPASRSLQRQGVIQNDLICSAQGTIIRDAGAIYGLDR
jgi:hypothetical protein